MKRILVSVETGEEVLFSRDRWEMNCIGDKGLVLTQHTADFEPGGLYYFDFGTGMLEQLDFDARQYTAKHWIAGESGMHLSVPNRNSRRILCSGCTALTLRTKAWWIPA